MTKEEILEFVNENPAGVFAAAEGGGSTLLFLTIAEDQDAFFLGSLEKIP